MTPSEYERLALLVEELGEAQHAIGKVLQHGYEATNPASFRETTVRASLERELGDVMFVIELMATEGDVSETRVDDAISAKAKRIWRHTYFQDPERYFDRHPSRRKERDARNE